jgi:hypothetical protein
MKFLAPVRSAEHEHEAQHGLPEPLPAGEQLLWQGSPSWRLLARHAFHLRKLGLYFVALLAWAAAVPFAGRWFELASADTSGPAARALPLLVWYALLAALALGLVAWIAHMAAQAAVYTLTDKRVVMRIGIVLTVSFNLPLKRIEAAEVRPLADGHGDIALLLEPQTRIGWLQLWPHARPWQLRRTQPMLRCVPDAERVAELLRSAWLAQNPQAPQVRAASVSPLPRADIGTATVHG